MDRIEAEGILDRVAAPVKKFTLVRSSHGVRSFFGTSKAVLATGGLAFICLVLISLYSFSPNSRFRPEKNLPWVAHLEGHARIVRCATGNPETIQTLIRLRPGDIVKCDSASEMLLQLDPGTALYLRNGAVLKIDKIKDAIQQYSLQNGDVFARVAKRARGHKLLFVTPDAVCTVVGTQFKVSFDSSSAATELMVAEGCVTFQGEDKKVFPSSLAVKAGTQVQSKSKLSYISAPGMKMLQNELDRIPMPFSAAKDMVDTIFTIKVESVPSGATVSFGSVVLGVTPLLRAVKSETLEVTVALDGFKAWNRKYVLSVEKPLEIVADLQAVSGDGGLRLRKPLPPTMFDTIMQENSTTFNRLLEDAIKLYVSDEQGRSLKQFESIITNKKISHVNRSRALHSAFSVLRNSGDCINAKRLTTLFLEGNPELVTADAAEFELAQMYYNNCNHDKISVDALNDYLVKYPKGIFTDEAYGTLAEIHSYYGRFQEASSMYELLLKRPLQKSQQASILYRLAHLYDRRLNNPDAAIKIYSQIIELHGGTMAEEALFWKGDCLYRSKRYEEAGEVFGIYLKQFPSGAWFHEALLRLQASTVSSK